MVRRDVAAVRIARASAMRAPRLMSLPIAARFRGRWPTSCGKASDSAIESPMAMPCSTSGVRHEALAGIPSIRAFLAAVGREAGV